MKLNLFLICIFIVLLINDWSNAGKVKDDEDDGCPEIVTKRRWGGRRSVSTNYQILPIKYVVIHHTVTATCNTKSKCATTVANIQSYYMNDLEYADIGYNFLIGNDGRVYEGVGWHIEGAHTYGYNKKGLGVAFIGDFSDELPTTVALDAAKSLFACGVRKGELHRNYKLLGGRQLIASESPGIELYGEIQDWDHWVELP